MEPKKKFRQINYYPTSASAGTNATLFVQNNQIQLHANGGTYGLALLEDGSLIATPQTSAIQHKTFVAQVLNKALCLLHSVSAYKYKYKI